MIEDYPASEDDSHNGNQMIAHDECYPIYNYTPHVSRRLKFIACFFIWGPLTLGRGQLYPNILIREYV